MYQHVVFAVGNSGALLIQSWAFYAFYLKKYGMHVTAIIFGNFLSTLHIEECYRNLEYFSSLKTIGTKFTWLVKPIKKKKIIVVFELHII